MSQSISDTFVTSNGPTNGAIVYAYKASRFSSEPALNGSPPGVYGADAGPVTTGTNFGGPGAFVISVPTNEAYYLSFAYNSQTTWKLYTAVSFADVPALGGTASGGQATLSGTLDAGLNQIKDGASATGANDFVTLSQMSNAISTIGGGGVSSFNGRTNAVTLTKTDVTGTGLSASDLGAVDTAGTGLTKSGTTLSLSSVGSASTTGDASHTLTITTNAQGQVTAVVANGIAITHSAITDWAAATAAFLLSLTSSDGSVTVGGTSTAPTVSLPAVGTAGTSGDASHTITITTDVKGRVSAVTVNAISIPHSQISDWGTATAAFLTSAVTTFNTRSGAVTLTKADVTGTGLTYSDVGADASGAAASKLASFQGRTNTAATLTKADVTGTGLTYSDVNADVAGAAAGVQTNLNAEITRATTAEATKIDTAGAGLTKSGTTMSMPNTGTSGVQQPKVTTDSQGRVVSSAPLVAGDIPNIAESQVSGLTSDLASKAPLASPAFTGTPTAPTPAALDSSASLATTFYVDSAVAQNVPTLLESVALTVYGHSFTQDRDPLGIWPPTAKGTNRTWPARVANRLKMTDWMYGTIGIRNGGRAGIAMHTVVSAMLSGLGLPIDNAYSEVQSYRQWNPGRPNNTTATNGDPGVILLQTAVNDALQWLWNPESGWVTEFSMAYGGNGTLQFARLGYANPSTLAETTLLGYTNTQIATALASVWSNIGFSLGSSDLTVTNVVVPNLNTNSTNNVATVNSGAAAANYFKVGDRLTIAGAHGGGNYVGNGVLAVGPGTFGSVTLTASQILLDDGNGLTSSVTNAATTCANRWYIICKSAFPQLPSITCSGFSTKTRTATAAGYSAGCVGQFSYRQPVVPGSKTVLDSIHSTVPVTMSGSTATILPFTITTTAGSNQATFASNALLPSKGQFLIIPGANYDGSPWMTSVTKIGTIDGLANARTVQFASACPVAVTASNCWTVPANGDSFYVNNTVVTITIPASITGGIVKVRYAGETTSFAYNASLSAIQGVLSTLVAKAVTGTSCSGTSGTLATGAAFTFSASVGDMAFDFTQLTSTVNSIASYQGSGCSAVWSGTLYYATASAVWGTPSAAFPTSGNGTLTIALNGSPTGTNVAALRRSGQWYGGNNGPYGAGALAAWKQGFRTMLRYARCNVSAIDSNGNYSGLNKNTTNANISTAAFTEAFTNAAGSSTFYLKFSTYPLPRVNDSVVLSYFDNTGTQQTVTAKVLTSVYVNGGQSYFTTDASLAQAQYPSGFSSFTVVAHTANSNTFTVTGNQTATFTSGKVCTVTTDWQLGAIPSGVKVSSSSYNSGTNLTTVTMSANIPTSLTGFVMQVGTYSTYTLVTMADWTVDPDTGPTGFGSNSSARATVAPSVTAATGTAFDVATGYLRTGTAQPTLITCSVPTNGGQGAISPSYTIPTLDTEGTGEVIVVYPAFTFYSSNGTPQSKGTLNPKMNGTNGTTISNLSGMPWAIGTSVLAVNDQPDHMLHSQRITTTQAANTVNTLALTKNNSDTVQTGVLGTGQGLPASFDSVFTTTKTPPWVVIVPEPTATGGLMNGNTAYHDLMQAYIDVAAESEFAWYVAVVPPITSLSSADLHASDMLHPTDSGALKITSAVCNFLTTWYSTFANGPLPVARPTGEITGLLARIGYN